MQQILHIEKMGTTQIITSPAWLWYVLRKSYQSHQLSETQEQSSQKMQCPFCPVSMIDVLYIGPAMLHRHLVERHPGKMVHHCNDCNNMHTSEANYRWHVAIVDKKQCIYCDEVHDCQLQFVNTAQLQQHVAATHNQAVCHFCRDVFISGEGLYQHQTEHCQHW